MDADNAPEAASTPRRSRVADIALAISVCCGGVWFGVQFTPLAPANVVAIFAVAFVGGLSAFIGLCAAVARLAAGGARRGVRLRRAACLVLLIGHALAWMLTLRHIRVLAKTTITASNLQGIGKTLHMYTDKYGPFPPSLKALVAEGWVIEEDLTPIDIVARSDGAAPPEFVYLGATMDPAQPYGVLAYERDPGTPCEMRIFAPYGRYVLLADGRVVWMDEATFQAALAETANADAGPASRPAH